MQSEERKNFFMQTLKAVIISYIMVLVLVLIFALIVNKAFLGERVIKIVNQILKMLAIFIGCIFGLKGDKGYIKGGVVGLIFAIITYITFALIGSPIKFSAKLIFDLLILTAWGLVSGSLAVNLRKKE